MEKLGRCVLCGSTDRSSYAEENGYQALQCRSCGLVQVDPRPSLDEMRALYTAQQTKVDHDQHICGRDLKSIQARRCLSFVTRFRSSGDLLEIGSAAGYFLCEAKRVGFNVQGLDITPQFARFARDVLGVPTVEGTLLDAPLSAESYDVIYHRNVLSHLAYPIEEFERMRQLLRPGGHLIFETGNVAELSPQDAGALELPEHLFHYSEAAIVRLLRRTGFQWLGSERFRLVGSLAPLCWAARMSNRWRSCSGIRRRIPGSPEGEDSSVPPQPPMLPTSLPPTRLNKRLYAYARPMMRYTVGRWLPKSGRCTLVVTALRPPEGSSRH